MRYAHVNRPHKSSMPFPLSYNSIRLPPSPSMKLGRRSQVLAKILCPSSPCESSGYRECQSEDNAIARSHTANSVGWSGFDLKSHILLRESVRNSPSFFTVQSSAIRRQLWDTPELDSKGTSNGSNGAFSGLGDSSLSSIRMRLSTYGLTYLTGRQRHIQHQRW